MVPASFQMSFAHKASSINHTKVFSNHVYFTDNLWRHTFRQCSNFTVHPACIF